MPTATKNGATSEAGEKTVLIPEIRLQRVVITIEGATELITHRFGDAAQAKMEAQQQQAAKVAKPPRDPHAEYVDSLYVIAPNDGTKGAEVDPETGRFGFPGAGIKKALVAAGGRFADEKFVVLRGLINIQGDLIEIRGGKPRMRRDPCKLASGVSSITYRPGFPQWEADIPVVFNAGMISLEQVLNLFQIAGFSIGIGDWRPEKNGTFGQFVIKGFQEWPA